MPETSRYAVTFKDAGISAKELASLLMRPEESICDGCKALETDAEPLPKAVNFFSEVGVAYVDLPEEEALRLQDTIEVEQIRSANRLSYGEPKENFEEELQAPAIAQPIPDNVKMVKADQVWSQYTGKNVKAAVIGTGIDLDHEDLVVSGGVCVVPGETGWEDNNWHGTHCAGIMAAKNNSSGIIGVAPDCELYAIRSAKANGNGHSEWLLAGLLWAARNGISVVSMSRWDASGADTANELPWTDVERGAKAVMNSGGVVVGIAGNSGEGTSGGYPTHFTTNPGRCPSVMTVANVDSRGEWYLTSAYGPDTLPDLQGVEIAAPGVAIRSSMIGGGYGFATGTSMACPHVAGAVALLKEAFPSWTGHEIRERLKKTAKRPTQGYSREKFGEGILDCYAAINDPVI